MYGLYGAEGLYGADGLYGAEGLYGADGLYDAEFCFFSVRTPVLPPWLPVPNYFYITKELNML